MHKGYSTDFETSNKYKYNGKELQDELGLNVYDMEARNYMPDIGRWGNIDELAENFQEYSPYNFSKNNPIYFSDPSGLAPEGQNYMASTFIDPTGKVVEHRDDNDPNIYLVGNSWQPGGAKSGLSIVGHEDPNVTYRKGDQVMIDFLSGRGLNLSQKASGAATPIGDAFDIFGF